MPSRNEQDSVLIQELMNQYIQLSCAEKNHTLTPDEEISLGNLAALLLPNLSTSNLTQPDTKLLTDLQIMKNKYGSLIDFPTE